MTAGGVLWRAAGAVTLALLAALILFFLRRPRPTAMGWMQHADELRLRILVSLASVIAVSAFLFSFDWVGAYPRPALHENLAARLFGRIRDDLLPADVTLVVARPMDGFAAEMTIALGAAIVLAAPLWSWQLGGFVWPALAARERRIILQAFVPVVLLFLAGAAFAYIVVLPFLLETLYDYGTALGAQGLLPVSDFVGFVLGMVLVFGVAFQTPLVMWALTRTGLVAAASWRRYWRHAVVAIVILAAIVTDPTVVSQALVAAPLILLYVIGIGLAMQAEKARG